MNILFAVFVLVCLTGSVACVFACFRHVEDVYELTAKLKVALPGIEARLEQLQTQHKKLSGRFYAALQQLEEDNLAGTDPPPTSASGYDFTAATHAMQACENYAVAQKHGPSSEAARCECVYCATKRLERDQARKSLVPRTVQGQAELARLNAGKP